MGYVGVADAVTLQEWCCYPPRVFVGERGVGYTEESVVEVATTSRLYVRVH